MQTIDVRNVHQAIPEGCYQMRLNGVERDSRNGPVRMLPTPLTTVYRNPLERVEFWGERDSNPFFHLMESIWMLAGRNDVEFVSQFSSGIGQFSDDGISFNGAYGYRWRHWFNRDQLEIIAQNLRDNPNCRRQVLAMWDGHDDLGNTNTKDVPCNTTAYLQLNVRGELDLMVCNRSNDLIWGAYGANAVHFSVLLEYMAALVGVQVGRYYQVSMNTHVYERHFDLMDQLADEAPMPPSDRECPYGNRAVQATPLMDPDMDAWHRDLDKFMAKESYDFETPVFRMLDVVREAYLIFKDKTNTNRHKDAIEELHRLPEGSDWRLACELWLLRRLNRVAV